MLLEGRRAESGVGSDWSGVFFFFRNVARVSDLEGGREKEKQFGNREERKEKCRDFRKSVQILGAWGKFTFRLCALAMSGSDLVGLPKKQWKSELCCDLWESRLFL